MRIIACVVFLLLAKSSWSVIDLTSRLLKQDLDGLARRIQTSSLKSEGHFNLIAPVGSIYEGELIYFELPGKGTIEGRVDSVTPNADTIVASGFIEGGTFYLSLTGDVVVADVFVHDEDQHYLLRPHDAPSGSYAIRMASAVTDITPEVESEQLDGAQHGSSTLGQIDHAASPSSTAVAPLALADTNNILDVMFIFTPQAFASVGSSYTAMQALAALSVQMSNDAYANSKVPLRMRSVSVVLTDYANYVEISPERELIRLRYDYDNYFDTDVRKRASLGADVVVLFASYTETCGQAYYKANANTAFAAISTQCPDAVARLIGYNIGLNADRVAEHNYDYSQYAFGYCWDTGPSSCRRSVMAESSCVTTNLRTNCPRAQFFSSPLVVDGELGRPTGLTTSDNARMLREQTSRVINWVRSTTQGGLITAVQPSTAPLGRCEPIKISGWRIGTGSDIVSVTLAGLPVQRIILQDQDSVLVLASQGAAALTGDVVVTTSSGYTTTLSNGFAYQNHSGTFVTDFDAFSLVPAPAAASNGGTVNRPSVNPLGVNWASVGVLDWAVLRFCDSVPCNSTMPVGPLVGYGGSGNFAMLHNYDITADTGVLEAQFNTNPYGCVDRVESLSLQYHLYTSRSECHGNVSVQLLDAQGRWSTILAAQHVQRNQSDLWEQLQYTFPHPEQVRKLRIIAEPYSGPPYCYFWSAVFIDSITVVKNTTCPADGCDFISPWPTAAPTAAPSSRVPTLRPTPLPTFTPRPTTMPSAKPTYFYRPAIEYVHFDCAQPLSGVTAEQFRSTEGASGTLLSTAAAALGVGRDSLCCLTITDATTAAAAATQRKEEQSVGIVATYQVELVVHRQVPQGLPQPPGLSPEAQAVFAAATQRLTAVVQVGNFTHALVAALPSLPSLTADPLASDSIAPPTSFTITLTPTPTMQPTIYSAPGSGTSVVQWTAATVIVLAAAAVVVGLVMYGFYKFCPLWCGWSEKSKTKGSVNASQQQPPAPPPASFSTLLQEPQEGDVERGKNVTERVEHEASDGDDTSTLSDPDRSLPNLPRLPSVQMPVVPLSRQPTPRNFTTLQCGVPFPPPPGPAGWHNQPPLPPPVGPEWWAPPVPEDEEWTDRDNAVGAQWEASLSSLAYGRAAAAAPLPGTVYGGQWSRQSSPRNYQVPPVPNATPRAADLVLSRPSSARGNHFVPRAASADAASPRPGMMRQSSSPRNGVSLASASADNFRPPAPVPARSASFRLTERSAIAKTDAVLAPGSAPEPGQAPITAPWQPGMQRNFPGLVPALRVDTNPLPPAYSSDSVPLHSTSTELGQPWARPSPRLNRQPSPRNGSLAYQPSLSTSTEVYTPAGRPAMARQGSLNRGASLASVSVDYNHAASGAIAPASLHKQHSSPRNFASRTLSYDSAGYLPVPAAAAGVVPERQLSRAKSEHLRRGPLPLLVDIATGAPSSRHLQAAGKNNIGTSATAAVMLARQRSERQFHCDADMVQYGMMRAPDDGVSPSSVAAPTPRLGMGAVRERVSAIEGSLSGKHTAHDLGGGSGKASAVTSRSFSRSASGSAMLQRGLAIDSFD